MKKLHGRMAASLDRSSIEHLLSASGAHSDRGDGGTLLYVFELPEGSLLSPCRAGAPRRLATRFRRCPRHGAHPSGLRVELLEPGYLAATPILQRTTQGSDGVANSKSHKTHTQ
jgi:hypothetical protein